MNYFDPKVLAKLKNLYLRAKFVVDGLMIGIHPSRSKGFSSEFEEHREYTQGDDIRHIDWKAYGKSDRFFIKEYREATNLRGHILLDCSSSMRYASDGWSKFDYGATLAASSTYRSFSLSIGRCSNFRTEQRCFMSCSTSMVLCALSRGCE